MQRSQWLFVSSFAVTAVLAQAENAAATLPGIITVPVAACALGGLHTSFTNGFICPFTTNNNGYGAMSVSTIYADYVTQDTTGSAFAAACVQSWSGGSQMCAAATFTNAVGDHDVSVPVFSTITGASGSVWDYYFVELYVGEFVQDPSFKEGLGVPNGNPPGSPTRFFGVGFQ